MKTTRLLRVLTFFGFLLLFAPFYDSCEGHYLHKVKTDGSEIKQEKTFIEKVNEVIFDDRAFNAFEIASLSIYAIKDSTFIEFKTEISKSFKQSDWYKNIGLFISVLFDFTVLISFLMFVLAFTKKIIYLNKLALVNCILVLVTFLYIIFLESSFENWSQIKWGYYAFIITNFLIYYGSRRNFKSNI